MLYGMGKAQTSSSKHLLSSDSLDLFLFDSNRDDEMKNMQRCYITEYGMTNSV